MNRIDQLKKLRLEEELHAIDADFVYECATSILDSLVIWSNQTIFSKIGGELNLELKWGAPNAGIEYKSLTPLKPVIVIYRSLLTEIYMDARAFSILSRHLLEGTDLLAFQEEEPWKGVPTLLAGHVNDRLSSICEEFASAYEIEGEGKFDSSDARCRFIMFELMLVWTFFHELGHVLQQHYRLRVSSNTTDKLDVYLEIPDPLASAECIADTAAVSGTSDLAAQARELMADGEAIDLTLKYLYSSQRLCFPVVYLFYCSTGSRSTVFTGLFRSLRVEERLTESSLPSYMRLLVEGEHQAGLRSYLERLAPFVEAQIAKVREWHLMPENRMEEWLRGFDALRRTCGAAAGNASN
eukprot:gene33250-41028_t